MKTKHTLLVAALSLLTSVSLTAQEAKSCFWIDGVSNLSPASGTTLTNGNHTISGNYSDGNFYMGDDIGTPSGTFEFTVSLANSATMTWDAGLGGFMFNTGDLLAGNLEFTIDSDSKIDKDDWKLCEQKLLICEAVADGSNLAAEIESLQEKKQSVYFGYVSRDGRTTKLTELTKDHSDGKGGWLATINEKEADYDYSKERIAFYTGDERNGFTELNNSSDSNSVIKIGGCICSAVPEPSTTAMVGLGGLAFLLRRRR